jgi:hypothetical protein
MRGAIRPTTAAEAVERARSMIGYCPELPEGAPSDAVGGPIRYRLRKKNGGKDPNAPHPAAWSYGVRVPTADCVGFVAWTLGFDRYQPRDYDRESGGDVIYGGWINTDSMIMGAAALEPGWFQEIDEPEVGAIVVYGSRYRRGRPRKAGHVGMIVDPLPAEFEIMEPDCWRDLRVVHCSSGNDRRHGAAIQETSGAAWAKALKKGRKPQILRYVRAA